jgi:hypothetical protein
MASNAYSISIEFIHSIGLYCATLSRLISNITEIPGSRLLRENEWMSLKVESTITGHEADTWGVALCSWMLPMA